MTNKSYTHQRKFDFSTSTTTPGIAKLVPKMERAAQGPAPRVFYTPEAYDIIQFLVGYCKKEVGWLGLVEQIGNDYLITDIYVPEQLVHGAETDIDTDAMTALVMEILDSGKDSSKLYYWGHSHVDMGVTPSGQDETQVDEYLVDCPKFIRGIYNKRGESKVDVFHRDEEVVYLNVQNRIFSPGLTKESYDALKKLVDENVTERTYSYPNSFGGYGGHNWKPPGTPGTPNPPGTSPEQAANTGRRKGRRLGNGAYVFDDDWMDDTLPNGRTYPKPRSEDGVLGYDDLVNGLDYL